MAKTQGLSKHYPCYLANAPIAQTIDSIRRVRSLRAPDQSTNDESAAKPKNPHRNA